MSEVRNAISQALADGRYLMLDGSNSPMTGDIDMGQNDIHEVGALRGGALVSDNLDLHAHDAAMVDPDADGKIKLHNFLTFNGITDFTGTTDANFQLIVWNPTVDVTGQGVVIPQGLWYLPTFEYDTAQSFGGAASFQDGSQWKEMSAIVGAHGAFDIGSFLGGTAYVLNHAGVGKPPNSVYGYDAGPRADAGPGTLTMPEMFGYATNRPFNLKSFLALEALRNGVVCTKYSHFIANSDVAFGLLLHGGSTIAEEIGLDLRNINKGTVVKTIISDQDRAYMEHAGDIRIPSDTRGLILGAGLDAYLKFTGSALEIKANVIGVNDNILLDSDTRISAGKDLDCRTLGAYFKPRRLRQAAIPVPDVDELLVWSDSDDDTVWLVYNDTTGGVKSIQLT